MHPNATSVSLPSKSRQPSKGRQTVKYRRVNLEANAFNSFVSHCPSDQMTDCFNCDSMRVMHICVLSAFSFTALVSVISRLWARKIRKIQLELDDYLCIVGLV